MITIFFADGDQKTLRGEPTQAEETTFLPTNFRVVDYGASGALSHSSLERGFSVILQEGPHDTVDQREGVRIFGDIWPNNVESIIFSQTVVVK